MKNLLILAVSALSFFAGPALANVPEPLNIAPIGAEVGNFPFLPNGGLTKDRAEGLGLRLEKLKRVAVFSNHFRQDGSWRNQVLLVGDEVWVEKATGIPRYRAVCANRIHPVVPCPSCGQVAPKMEGGNGGSSSGSGSSKDASAPLPSLGGRVADAFGKALGDSSEFTASALGWFVPLLIVGSIIGLAGFGLWTLFQRRQAPPVASVVPAQPQPTPPQAPGLPQQQPQPSQP